MTTPGENAALAGAFARYAAFSASLRAVADGADFGTWITGARQRMDQIADDAAANVYRFRTRRDELIQAEPTDHEAILAYVDGINEATGTRLAQSMAAELKVSDPAAFVAAVAQDAIGNVKTMIALAVVATAAFFYFTRR